MTSNPKVQNRQRSSAISLHFGSEKFRAVVCAAAQNPSVNSEII
jgi:hypothetical protein